MLVSGSFITSITLEHTLFLRSQSLSTNNKPKVVKTGPRTFSQNFDFTTSVPINLPFPNIRFQTAPTDEPSIHAFGHVNRRKVLFDDICGLPNLTKPLIVNGSPSEKGAHPWHVALYVKTDLGISYMCGGNLISDRHVLTGKFRH